MNPETTPYTKPALKSTTIIGAIATIFASLAVLVGAYSETGEIPALGLLLVELPILAAQGRIIYERLKPNRKPIKGIV